MSDQACQARPRAEVLAEVMDCSRAKSEHEHVAADEILQLRAELCVARDSAIGDCLRVLAKWFFMSSANARACREEMTALKSIPIN